MKVIFINFTKKNMILLRNNIHHQFHVNKFVGGDCSLIRQFHLSNKEDQSHASSSPEAVKMEQQTSEATGQVDEGIVGGRMNVLRVLENWQK